ncbi:J domain-containing protein [Massilia sp. PAMC28688]|uniref:DnaJ C-terminal domain-containing protein n=1 Tax=Massilia sp. PAMC28688 TaxID=2861283 RepID=UPI001C62E871|nr:J domain-containing protein [Massilia sp. PAMC28688]QYF94084.1 J domain-containing protein [Massilia sp. PAMC28688]
MEYKDYYKTLGVARNASAEDIKAAYRRLVRKHHPDISKATDADQKTKEINEAYAVLGDAEKRAAYDAPAAGMHGQRSRPPDWGAGSFGRAGAGPRSRAAHGFPGQDFGSAEFAGADFFSDLFAQAGTRRRGATAGQPGEDIHATMPVSLHDIYHGASRLVSLQLPGGAGEQQVHVTIPKGALPGQQLRMPGQGRPGYHGGPPGDLVLELQLRPEPRYRVEGKNVIARLPVTPWEAALGASIDVATPSGQVSVTVPAGSQGGRKLRLRGRGLPAHPAGDLYLELEVVLPPADHPRARELYQAMARELAFNPRAATRS